MLGLVAPATAQTCTAGLCTQQVTCPGNGTTSITGTVFAPNGTDPLPNVTVYVPTAPVAAFTPGVTCSVVGEVPSGAPLVGTVTGVDGTFTLTNVPVGTNLPLVIQAGRWRRQVVVPGTAACANTAFSTRMPRNRGEGDIPKIAVATGAADAVECVLRKVGVDDAEFTDPSQPGRINLYAGSAHPGGRNSTFTPSEDLLMGDASTLDSYDMLMLPCEGSAFTRPAAELADLVQFANAGGRVYASHFSYSWMVQNPPFSTVVNWDPRQHNPANGTATVNTSFSEGQTLAQWLQLEGASTTQGQVAISTLRHDFNGVVAPTQAWLTLNDTYDNNPVMQFVFDTPVGATANQCGRVLFNEYHVENPLSPVTSEMFPQECSAGAMTPQEKLLEYSLFELTNNGGQPTLAPTTQDFGSEAVGFSSTAQTLTWKNNSVFGSSVTSLAATGDFMASSSNCSAVPAGSGCQISVVFKPTALGPRTGTVTIVSSGNTLTAALTGIGTPGLSMAASSLGFGNLDVGASATQSITLTNTAPGPIAMPVFTTSGDYAVATNCGSSIPALASCSLNVTFTPTGTGARDGVLAVNATGPIYAGLGATLAGNGTDFSIAVNPGAGSVVSGRSVATSATITPIAGFDAPVSLSCTTAASATTCTPAAVSFVPTAAVTTSVTIATTSKYTVVGYGGLGGGGLLWMVGMGSGWLLWMRRRRTGGIVRGTLAVLLLAAATFTVTACSGKYPAMNSSYTPAGSYTYTLTATDGTLTHSATYTLKVQ